MARPYILRTIEETLQRAVSEFPAVVHTGPRQSGKTTVLRHLIPGHDYVAFDAPNSREAAVSDPRGFLALHPPPVILDEIQYVPPLLSYLKEAIDRDRARTGQYIVTGSQNLLRLEQVSETLAGRAAVLRLLPLSRAEARGEPGGELPWRRERRAVARADGPSATTDIWRSFPRGGFPELASQPERDAELWFQSYFQTHLERDVRALRQVGDLGQFQAFLRVTAARSGQVYSYSDVARDLGVAVNTVKSWLGVLEATHQAIILRPWFVSVGKRLVKSPKVYLTDVGTLGQLAGLREPAHIVGGPLAGAIFETAVIAEVLKAYLHRGRQPEIYFWRTSTGQEVDLIVETPEGIVPIECKATATPRVDHGDAVRRLRSDVGDRVRPGYVVHAGTHALPLGEGVTGLPLDALVC